MYFSKNVRDAMFLANAMYVGTVDNAGYPYIYHCIAVAERQVSEDETVVALLHDIIEDGKVKLSDLTFNENVKNALVAITRQKGEKYFDYIERLKMNEIARYVKIADLNHNLQNRGYEIPTSLKERYKKARAILLQENVNEFSKRSD